MLRQFQLETKFRSPKNPRASVVDLSGVKLTRFLAQSSSNGDSKPKFFVVANQKSAAVPELSPFLSAWERLDNVANEYSGWLSPIEIDEMNDPLGEDAEPNGRRCSRKGILTMSVLRYIDLVEWCGREIRSDKRGSIPSDLSPILGRLGLDGQTLIGTVIKSGNGLQTAEGLSSVSTSELAAPST